MHFLERFSHVSGGTGISLKLNLSNRAVQISHIVNSIRNRLDNGLLLKDFIDTLPTGGDLKTN